MIEALLREEKDEAADEYEKHQHRFTKTQICG
jgi:hypothetical protein